MTTTRFASLVERIDIKAGKTGASLPLLSVSQTLGVLRFSDLHDRPPRADSFDVYKVVEPGDIAFNKMSIRSGAVGVVPERGIVTYHYEVMRPRAGVDARFVVALMKSSWFIGELIRNERGIGAGGAAGVRTTEVPFSVMRAIRIPQFAVEEQRKIADYLDRETADIDSLIDLWNELLTLAQERKQAYLDNVVTSSTDKFVRVKHLLTRPISDGPHETPDFLDQGIPFLSVDGIQDGELVFEGCRYVSREDHLRYSKKIYPLKGDVLMGKAASTGKIALVRTEREFNVWSPLAVLRPNISLVSGDWLTWALKSTAAQVQIDLACTFNTQKNIAMSDIGDLEVPVPSLEDQSRLVGTLDGFSNRAREVEKEISAAIELATERRAALISATVTGQVDISPQGAPVAESLRNELEVRV